MPKRSFYINESELDDYQVLVLQKRVDKPAIVKGCAGSGKSILALHRVKQIQEEKIGTFYFILFTKALKKYMQDGIESIGLHHDRVIHYEKWLQMNTPSADYIIVDEAQDFSQEEIQLFQSKANQALIMFGDTVQQIYSFKHEKSLSMEDIASLTSIPSSELSFNHRLPKKIARFAEYFTKEETDLALRCRNEGIELPKVLEFNSLEEQFDKIIEIIQNRKLDDIGILFPTNDDVRNAQNYFNNRGIKVEAKYHKTMNLDFNNSLPKITTYHSSKGLQFEAVFIPKCNETFIDNLNVLYVAVTRTYQSLYIMYSGNISPLLDGIPNHLFETSLVEKTTRRL